MIIFKDSIARPASAAPRYVTAPLPPPPARPAPPPAPVASQPTREESRAQSPASAAVADSTAAATRRAKARLEDFGAKIGGARKDSSQPQAVAGEGSATEMIQAAWPPIDCSELIAKGHEPYLVRLVAELRANALANPEKFAGDPGRIAARMVALKVLQRSAVPMLLALPPALVSDQGQLTQTVAQGMVPVWKELVASLTVGTNNGRPVVSRAALFPAVNQPRAFFWNRFHRLHAEVERGWPAPCRQWAVRFAAQHWRNNAGQGRDGVWFVRKAEDRWTFSTEEEARSKAAEIFPQLSFAEPKEFVRLTVVRREGLPNYRGGAGITPDEFMATFRIRGVEWGNWTSQTERAEHLTRAADAFMDLSAALGMDPSSVSLGGRLALSFGARGKSKAAAHYEPDRRVINLTRHSGKGALAHEWFHAFDHFIFEEFKMAELGWRGERPYASAAHVGGLDGSAPRATGFAGIATWGAQRGLGERLAHLQRFLWGSRPTEFHRAARSIDGKRSSPYWGLPWELGARAFSAFIEDQLHAAGGRNEYLVHSTAADAPEFGGFVIYPRGSERTELNATWSQLVDFVRRTPTPRSSRPALLPAKSPSVLLGAEDQDGGLITIGRPRGDADIQNSL